MTEATLSLRELIDQYLEMRRGLGYRLNVQGALLYSFARFASAAHHTGPITIALALDWAESSASRDAAAQRLSVLRQFARHRAPFDPSTEIPPVDLIPSAYQRKPPHIYSDSEIQKLLHAAAALRPKGGLRPHTYVAFFSLLAATGLRNSEARSLEIRDVDFENAMLIIRESKSLKSRFVPLHPTTATALAKYAQLRDNYVNAPRGESFFRTDREVSLTKTAVEKTFVLLRRRLGWTTQGRARLPRVHDLRHTFAVRRCLRWHEEGVDVDKKMLSLATYLGHVNISDTYWYLSAVPELMAVTLNRFEAFAKAGREF